MGSYPILEFGSNGNIDLYVQNLVSGKFERLDYTSLSLDTEYADFDSMMIEAIKGQM